MRDTNRYGQEKTARVSEETPRAKKSEAETLTRGRRRDAQAMRRTPCVREPRRGQEAQRERGAASAGQAIPLLLFGAEAVAAAGRAGVPGLSCAQFVG